MNQQAIRSLIDLSVHGDKASFRRLVESHQDFVYATAFRLLCNDYDTEEVVQETFIRVWKNLDRFNNEMRFTTWLYKIVVNLCYDKMKAYRSSRNHFMVGMDGSLAMNQPSAENIETTFMNSELAGIIRFLTDQLTPKQKLVFTLVAIEELTVDEIVTITGMTPEKIKSNLYCAKQNIKKKLNRMEERRDKK